MNISFQGLLTSRITYIVVILVIIMVYELIIKRFFRYLQKKFAQKTFLIKRYWLAVGILSALTIITHILLCRIDSSSIIPLDLVNFYSSLLFGIIGGYIAFQTYELSRVEKLIKSAKDQFLQGYYRRAEKYYEEAIQINPTDFNITCEYAELLMLSGNDAKFEIQIQRMSACALENRDNLLKYYLISVNYFLDQNIKPGEKCVKEMIQYYDNNKKDFGAFGWSFKELEQSDRFKNLKGDSKKIVEAIRDYLEAIQHNNPSIIKIRESALKQLLSN